RRLRRFRLERELRGGPMGDVWVAQDTELDREVALKVIRTGAELDQEARDRLRVEAQAVGRLSHPNVVRIDELGSEGDVLFCAMELVDGVTLREWLAAPRRWREVLDVLLAAGRGVAASHAASLVHGALSADAILITPAGRTLVGNFAMGERAVDPLEDQRAFAAVMDEALLGGRAGRAPRGLARCIRRGQSPDPADRWPSMDALIAAASRAAALPRRRRRVALGVGLAAAIAGLALWRLRPAGDPERMVLSAGESRIAGAWNASTRAELLTALTRSGHPAAAAIEARVAAALDAYRAAWLAMRVDAWRATYLRDEQPADLLELRMACLDRLADELDAFVRLTLRVGPGDDVSRLARGAQGITPVTACSDRRQMAEILPGSIGGQAPEAVVRIETKQAELRATLLAGRPREAVEQARAAVDAAERVGQRALAANLHLLLASAHEHAGDYPAAEAELRRTLQHAADVRNHHLVATAWIRLVDMLGSRMRRVDEALALAPAATAAVAQAGDDPYQRADLRAALGAIEYARGHSSVASEHFRAAFEGFRAARGPDASVTADTEGIYALSLSALGKNDEAMVHAEHSYKVMLAVLGEHDLMVGKALSNLAGLSKVRGDAEGAARYAAKAVETLARTYGEDHPTTSYARCKLALALSELGRHDEALVQMTRAEAALRGALGAANPDVALTTLELAAVLEAAGDVAGAERTARPAVAALRLGLPAGHPDLATGLAQLARMTAPRAPREAVALYDEAMRIDTALPDRDDSADPDMLEEMGQVGLRAGRAAWALGWFDRLPKAAAQKQALRRRLLRARR
ncbi:MAG TPA: tetratricopeptide repeat-containing protein kinase family protein, partial [Kofleriaceae bacterium]|nr:tetratricopeptide repeat-containing protein kinase family protein [Kofleriaceae bacterium]